MATPAIINGLSKPTRKILSDFPQVWVLFAKLVAQSTPQLIAKKRCHTFKMTDNQKKAFYNILFIIGIILMYFGVKIYRITFIDWKIVLGIGLAGGLIAGYLNFKGYKKLYNYSGVNLYLFFILQVVICWAFIFSSLFLVGNYSFADSNTKSINVEIAEAGFLPEGGRHRYRRDKKPTFEIEYKNEIKTLVFYTQFFNERNAFKSIDLNIKNGFFGYDVITYKKLNE